MRMALGRGTCCPRPERKALSGPSLCFLWTAPLATKPSGVAKGVPEVVLESPEMPLIAIFLWEGCQSIAFGLDQASDDWQVGLQRYVDR